MATFYIKNYNLKGNLSKTITSRRFSDENKQKFMDLTTSTNWEPVLLNNSASAAFNLYNERMVNNFESAFPQITSRVTRKHCPLNPWTTEAILISRRQKDKLFKTKLKQPSYTNIDRFKNYNKVYQKVCRAAKFKHYHDRFEESAGNIKAIWDNIRLAMGSKGNKGNYPSYFNDNGNLLRDPKDIADGFNKFFATIGNHLADLISPGKFGFQDFLGQPHKINLNLGKFLLRTQGK